MFFHKTVEEVAILIVNLMKSKDMHQSLDLLRTEICAVIARNQGH
jgi:hypothetical protein